MLRKYSNFGLENVIKLQDCIEVQIKKIIYLLYLNEIVVKVFNNYFFNLACSSSQYSIAKLSATLMLLYPPSLSA